MLALGCHCCDQGCDYHHGGHHMRYTWRARITNDFFRFFHLFWVLLNTCASWCGISFIVLLLFLSVIPPTRSDIDHRHGWTVLLCGGSWSLHRSWSRCIVKVIRVVLYISVWFVISVIIIIAIITVAIGCGLLIKRDVSWSIFRVILKIGTRTGTGPWPRSWSRCTVPSNDTRRRGTCWSSTRAEWVPGTLVFIVTLTAPSVLLHCLVDLMDPLLQSSYELLVENTRLNGVVHKGRVIGQQLVTLQWSNQGLFIAARVCACV